MFVEKVSLFGFKSFNQKIVLDFGPGISGVVGPNGCGKSNIVDAIRWVLGEQSTKQLRGAKMEDVIFNGTREEKPLSLAEVTLTLNNERGRLPIDYGTVNVGRRLYRSGISEYTINKQPVRLKDVRNLFLDTGMGSHAYSVIERQMVDNILSDTTGHRRFLFEEAAGIMKYKTRKKEALNKLEATERDLLRVNDIVTEVERQVASLKRQVGKARRYRELQDEIRGMDLAYSQAQRRRWKGEADALTARHQDILQAAQAGDTEVASLEADLQKLHLIVLEEERRLGAAREELARVDDEIGRHNAEILVLRERLKTNRDRIQEARDHQVRLADRLERNEATTHEFTERLQGLEARGSSERARLDEGEESFQGADTRFRELRENAARAKADNARLRDERIRAEGEVDAARRRREELIARASATRERAETARRNEEERLQALEASRANVAAARERVTGIEDDRRRLVERRRGLEERTEELRGRLNRAREDEAAARSRLQTLEDLRERYEGFDRGVRALMLDGEKPAGVQGTIADLVRVPAEWMPALEPVLSRIWQYVVVENTATARRLLDHLREDALGYASLIPLDRVPECEARSGGLTWAAETVETAPAHRSLVRFLLYDLALVDDLDAALRVVQSGEAARAATRTGHFVDTAVLAGGEGGPTGSELVEREESLERVRTDIQALAAALGELAAREKEIDEERAGLERELAGVDERLEGAIGARTALEKEEAGLELERRHHGENREGLETEHGRLVEVSEVLEAEITAMEIRLEETEKRAGGAEESLGDLERRLVEAETRRDGALSEVHEMRMSWARLEGELKDAGSTLERLGQEREHLASERERTARDEQEATTRVQETERDLGQRARAVEDLHRDREGKLEVVTERERDKSEASAREQQDTDRLREVRKRATIAREAAHDTELKLNDLRADVRHLEARLREEYEIEPEDLDRLTAEDLPEDAPDIISRKKETLRRIGPVNLLAVEEYEEKKNRFEFMSSQRDDLVNAKDTLVRTIGEINKTASRMFIETFEEVQANFQKTFQVLFQGGECSLNLVGDDPLEADIDVTARPRGKRPQGIHQLSSGERALTAIALLFAIYLVKPSPFCILDEVDAPLDDANIDRFVDMLKKFSELTQFIVITHNKKTMEAADCLYGVTMQRPGVSSVVSVRLDGYREEHAEARPAAAPGGNGHGNGDGEHDVEEVPATPGPTIPQ